MNKNINKSCRYCITAFAAVTDRKLSLQGSVICWKWGVSGMLVTWDRAFSNSSVFRGLLVSLHSSGGSWGAHPGTEEPPDKPSTSLVSWHQALSQLWKPVGQLDSPWSSGDERSGMAWAEHGRQNIFPCQKFGCARNWVSLSHHLMMVMGTAATHSVLGIRLWRVNSESEQSLGPGRHCFHWAKLSQCLECQIWDWRKTFTEGLDSAACWFRQRGLPTQNLLLPFSQS